MNQKKIKITRTWYENIPICVGKETKKNCIVRQLQEKYNQKKLIELALRRKMVPERMVEAIMALYIETRE